MKTNEINVKMTAAEEAMFNAMFNNDNQENVPKNANKPTSKQLETIEKLCEQKGVKLDTSKTISFDTSSAYIQELLAMKNHIPPSEKQIDKIKEYCDILEIKYPNFNMLEGGFNGSASKMIQSLKKRVDNKPIPISEKQLSFIQQMQFCPDCEVIEEPEKLTKQEASDYITKYRVDYYAWVKNILSPEQQLRILQLNCMIEGVETKDISDDYNDPPLTIQQKIQTLLPRQSLPFSGLIQITKDMATEYIEQLESEYKSKIWSETTLEPEIDREFEVEYDQIRKELETLCTQLYGIMGQELEYEWFETFIGTSPFSFTELKELIDDAKLWDDPEENKVFSFIKNCKALSPEIQAMLVA